MFNTQNGRQHRVDRTSRLFHWRVEAYTTVLADAQGERTALCPVQSLEELAYCYRLQSAGEHMLRQRCGCVTTEVTEMHVIVAP